MKNPDFSSISANQEVHETFLMQNQQNYASQQDPVHTPFTPAKRIDNFQARHISYNQLPGNDQMDHSLYQMDTSTPISVSSNSCDQTASSQSFIASAPSTFSSQFGVSSREVYSQRETGNPFDD